MIKIGGFISRFFIFFVSGDGDQRLSVHTEPFPNDFLMISRQFPDNFHIFGSCWGSVGFIFCVNQAFSHDLRPSLELCFLFFIIVSNVIICLAVESTVNLSGGTK